MDKCDSTCRGLRRLVLERGYRRKAMAGRHIAISTWLEALGLQAYLPFFSNYGGVEDLLYASEAEIRDLGLKNSAHRAKIVSSLRILREKYEKGKPTGSGVFSLQNPRSPTSPTGPIPFQDLPAVLASPEKLQQDLQRELSADPSELKSRAWYHGNVSRQRAESLLVNNGDFLVRDSISKPGDFVLSCSWRGVPLHFMVNALVSDCAPGSLPSISYQFEDESFASIQDLIHFYLTRQKPVTLASGAVLRNPVSRSMPLSYYDSKYGSLHSLDSGGYYTPSQSPKPSPFASPDTSPKASPKLNRRGPKRTGSQPLLSVDDSEMERSRSPSLERFGSLPVINIIPPGGPGYSGPNRSPSPSPQPVVSHQRAGSAPALMNNGNPLVQAATGVPPSKGINVNTPGLTSSHSVRMTPTSSESNLSRPPPPKPSRVPSIKYKQRPRIAVRNKELYQDDGRDYTDVGQLSGPPSWADSERPGTGSELTTPHSPTVTKSHSFQGSRESQIYDNNFNIDKSYHTLPSKPKQTKHQTRTRLLSDTQADTLDGGETHLKTSIMDDTLDNSYNMLCRRHRQITMPGHNLGSRINLTKFTSTLLPAENRLLEPSAVMKVKTLLLSSTPRTIAGHVTRVDLEVLRVTEEDDYGVAVTSGLELCTLPQGEQLREDIIERYTCQRLFVMTSLMTCNAPTERARMLSQWIQAAGELRVTMGNVFAFASTMQSLTSPQVQRLRDTWLILRQNHTTSAYLFDTKLRPLYKSLNEANGMLPLQNISIPNVFPVVHLLQRDLDLDTVSSLLPWEAADPATFGLDFFLAHLDVARVVASQSHVYRVAGKSVTSEVKIDGELDDSCRTEFHLRLMWGAKGAGAPRGERLSKFEKLLMVLSERLEPPGDDGTEV